MNTGCHKIAVMISMAIAILMSPIDGLCQYDPPTPPLMMEPQLGCEAEPWSWYESYLRLVEVDGTFPASYDWRDWGAVTPARDQGSCASSWAFAATAFMESKALLRDGTEYDFSEQQLISCATTMSGCCGGSMSGLLFYENEGPMEEACTSYPDGSTQCGTGSAISCNQLAGCPTLGYRVSGFYTVRRVIKEMKLSLYFDGPAFLRFNVHQDFLDFWQNATPGSVYRNERADLLGGHAVLLIGWDNSKGAWLCKNSWGETGGPNGDGTFWIKWGGHATPLNFRMGNFRQPCNYPGYVSAHCWTPLEHNHSIGAYDATTQAWKWSPSMQQDPTDGPLSSLVLGNSWGNGTVWLMTEVWGEPPAGSALPTTGGGTATGTTNPPPPPPDPNAGLIQPWTWVTLDQTGLEAPRFTERWIEIADACFGVVRFELRVLPETELDVYHRNTCVYKEIQQ